MLLLSLMFLISYYYLLNHEFFTPALADGFSLSLSDSKSPQVSMTLHNILADLNNAVVWMVSTHPFISKSSSLFINPLVTVPRALITIGITVTLMFYSFFNSIIITIIIIIIIIIIISSSSSSSWQVSASLKIGLCIKFPYFLIKVFHETGLCKSSTIRTHQILFCTDFEKYFSFSKMKVHLKKKILRREKHFKKIDRWSNELCQNRKLVKIKQKKFPNPTRKYWNCFTDSY